MQGQLFTQDFLLRGILDTPPWQAFDDAAFGRFRAALDDVFSTLRAGSALNEAQTEQVVIERVLAELGWSGAWLRQVNLSDKGREDVPDLLLFPDGRIRQQTASPDTSRARRSFCLRHGGSDIRQFQ